MNCPVCNLALNMTERQGVEIDYCPKCRGVWLDRGELDKLIERATEQQPVQGVQQQVPQQPTVIVQEQRRYDSPRYRDDDYYRHKKRKSLLGEIFDF
jgi:uncharacterized protein